jgi:hypothetical protein
VGPAVSGIADTGLDAATGCAGRDGAEEWVVNATVASAAPVTPVAKPMANDRFPKLMFMSCFLSLGVAACGGSSRVAWYGLVLLASRPFSVTPGLLAVLCY